MATFIENFDDYTNGAALHSPWTMAPATPNPGDAFQVFDGHAVPFWPCGYGSFINGATGSAVAWHSSRSRASRQEMSAYVHHVDIPNQWWGGWRTEVGIAFELWYGPNAVLQYGYASISRMHISQTELAYYAVLVVGTTYTWSRNISVHQQIADPRSGTMRLSIEGRRWKLWYQDVLLHDNIIFPYPYLPYRVGPRAGIMGYCFNDIELLNNRQPHTSIWIDDWQRAIGQPKERPVNIIVNPDGSVLPNLEADLENLPEWLEVDEYGRWVSAKPVADLGDGMVLIGTNGALAQPEYLFTLNDGNFPFQFDAGYDDAGLLRTLIGA